MARVRIRLPNGKTGTVTQEEYVAKGLANAPGVETLERIDVNKGESMARGAAQGFTLRLGDEGAGAIAATLPFTDREAAQGETWGERYTNARDFYRRKNDNAREENPKTYVGGEVFGAALGAKGLGRLAPTSVSTTAAPFAAPGALSLANAAKAVPMGMAAGYGASESSDPVQQTIDTVEGGALAAPFGAMTPAARLPKMAGAEPFSWFKPRTWFNPKSLEQTADEKRYRSLRPTPDQSAHVDATFPGGTQGLGGYLNSVRHPFNGKPLLGPADRAQEIAQKVGQPLGVADRRVGQAVDAAGEAGGTFNVPALFEKIEQGPLARLRSGDTRQSASAAGKVEGDIEHLRLRLGETTQEAVDPTTWKGARPYPDTVPVTRLKPLPLSRETALKTELQDIVGAKTGRVMQEDPLYEGAVDRIRYLTKHQLEDDVAASLGDEGGARYVNDKLTSQALHLADDITSKSQYRGMGARETGLGAKVQTSSGGPFLAAFARPVSAVLDRVGSAEAYGMTRLAEALEGQPENVKWALAALGPDKARQILAGLTPSAPIVAPMAQEDREDDLRRAARKRAKAKK
jgi:hypothetical protein